MPPSPRSKEALALEEIEKRKRGGVDLLAGSFPAQRDMILDPARFKAVLCTRRAGKSYGLGIVMLMTAMSTPRATIFYLSKDSEQAKKIIFREILEEIQRHYAVPFEIVSSPSPMVKFPNGSVIYVRGLDATEQGKKLRGNKPDLVVIDEAQDILCDLEHVIQYDIRPSLGDKQGSVIIVGTPSERIGTYFYELTCGEEPRPGWKLFRWSFADNPYAAGVQAEMDAAKTEHPGIEKSPEFQREWYGKWSVDEEGHVYRVNDRTFSIDSLPEKDARGRPYQWNYLLSVDLGYLDSTAFVIGAYCYTDPTLYVLYAAKYPRQDLTATVQKMLLLREQYPFDRIIMDTSNRQGVEEMRNRFRKLPPIIAAPRAEKSDFIALMNMALQLDQIRVLPAAAGVLRKEWEELIWDPIQRQRGNLIEDRRCENHASDACLYLFRHSKQYLAEPVIARRIPTTADEIEEALEREFEEQMAREEARENDPFGFHDFSDYGEGL